MSAIVLAATAPVAVLPIAFTVWLHRDTPRFIEVIARGGLCAQIGSGPVQIRIAVALGLLAVAAIFAGAFAWRSLPRAVSLRLLVGGAVVAVLVTVAGALSVDAGAAVFGCWSR